MNSDTDFRKCYDKTQQRIKEGYVYKALEECQLCNFEKFSPVEEKGTWSPDGHLFLGKPRHRYSVEVKIGYDSQIQRLKKGILSIETICNMLNGNYLHSQRVAYTDLLVLGYSFNDSKRTYIVGVYWSNPFAMKLNQLYSDYEIIVLTTGKKQPTGFSQIPINAFNECLLSAKKYWRPA